MTQVCKSKGAAKTTPPVLLVLPTACTSGLHLSSPDRAWADYQREGDSSWWAPLLCTGECGISHVLPGDEWLAAVTPHQGRPSHLLPTDRCSPNSRPALLWRVSGLACGYFGTQPPTHALVGPGDAAAASHCWLLGHSRAKRDRRRWGGARPVPERRLPVKLVSTRRLSLAPVSPHRQWAGGARARRISTTGKTGVRSKQRSRTARSTAVRGRRGEQSGAEEVEQPGSMQSSLWGRFYSL